MITLSNASVAADAAQGTLVGILTCDVPEIRWFLPASSQTYFAVGAGTGELLTRWAAPILPGIYRIEVIASTPAGAQIETAEFDIVVGAVAPIEPPPVEAGEPTITATATSSLVTVSVAHGPGNQTDWVSLAPAGAADSVYGPWCYLSGTTAPPPTGLTEATFTMPAPAAGNYEARLYANNTMAIIARGAFTVGTGPVDPPIDPIDPVDPPIDTGEPVATTLWADVAMHSGAVYTFDPSFPDEHTTVVTLGDFVSDFAGFTQSSTMVCRNDTPLKVLFRIDREPDPSRYEIIIECGYPTTNGSAGNVGEFDLQLYDGDAVFFDGHFPSMGWHTRWRYNPRPRPEVRTREQLLDLNLVPKFSVEMAATLGIPNCGEGPDVGFFVTSYSSAYAPGMGNDLNPVGVNENCGIATNTGGVGGRPELGLVTDWQANWLANADEDAHEAMMVLAEVAGGMPWVIREGGIGSPYDFTRGANTSTTFGLGGATQVDIPTVTVPSGGGSGRWYLELNHLPALSYVPYLLTGDPYHLEHVQFAAAWCIGANGAHRGGTAKNGFAVNYADPLSPYADAGAIALMPSYFSQSRGLGWAFRSWAQAEVATPDTVPSWLLPRAQCKLVIDQNLAYAEEWGVDFPDYPALTTIGAMPGAVDSDAAFFHAYLMMGLTFTVVQAGHENARRFLEFCAQRVLNWTNGQSGWDNRLPAPYNNTLQAVSTDYTSEPGLIGDFAAMWDFYIANTGFGILNAWACGGATSGLQSMFPAYLPNTAYACNSWLVEFRGGVPVQPVAGERVVLTLGGGFSLTVTHEITAADVAEMATWTIVDVAPGPHPIIDDLMSQINAADIGVEASAANHASAGYWHTAQTRGRMYLSFDSAVLGPLTVFGSYETSTPCSLYIQPNGDGVHTWQPNPGAGLYGRTISYQCARSGISGPASEPSGTALQGVVADGTTAWCFCPELKSNPVCCPSIGEQAPFPRMMTVGTLSNPVYCALVWNACNLLLAAGVPGAELSQARIEELVLDYVTSMGHIGGINWAVATLS